MLATPTVYQIYDATKLQYGRLRQEVKYVWLYQNGEQILVQTHDCMLHRLNIIDNNSHTIIEKKNYLIFVINNCGREYYISSKDCDIIDYDIIDRMIKGVAIDTKKFQKLYHRLLYRK